MAFSPPPHFFPADSCECNFQELSYPIPPILFLSWIWFKYASHLSHCRVFLSIAMKWLCQCSVQVETQQLCLFVLNVCVIKKNNSPLTSI